jgi:hypothetical protein
MALAILTRPGGIFLVVSYFVVAAFLIHNRLGRRAIAGFLLPFPLLLALMSAYNHRVVGVFAPTTWGEANLAVATFTYWDTNALYPDPINRDIARIQQIIRNRFSTTHKDPRPIHDSWRPRELASLFVEGFNDEALKIALSLGGSYETTGRAWIRRISLDAIHTNPTVYLRFVWAMLYSYFTPSEDFDFRIYLRYRVLIRYVENSYGRAAEDPFLARLLSLLSKDRLPRGVVVDRREGETCLDLRDCIEIAPTPLWRLYELTHRLRKAVFEHWLWSIAVFVALAASCVVLVRSRGRSAGAFVLFIMTLSAVGASLVVSLVEFSQPRYSYPMEWVYGLSVVLLPLLRDGGADTSPPG